MLGYGMASITIRQLDEDLKKRLRLLAAPPGRSMEDEVRVILRPAATSPGATDATPRTPKSRAKPASAPAALHTPDDGSRVLLIIGGGIAAYKSLDLIR